MTEKQKEMIVQRKEQALNRLKSKNPDIEVFDYQGNREKTHFHCKKCGHDFYMTLNKLNERDCRCPYCGGKNKRRKICERFPDLKEWFVNEQDFYQLNVNSQEKTEIKCPICGEIEETMPKVFLKRTYLCQNCKTKGISKPNKFLRELLKEIDIQIEEKIFEWNPNWSKKYRYDCYIKTKNNSFIIEMNGEQHYHETNWGGFEYQIKRDKEKRELAAQNNIKIIEINCENTSYVNMKNQILKSELSLLLDFSNVEWERVCNNSSQNYIKNISEMYNNGDNLLEIAQYFNLRIETVKKYLKQGHEFGLNSYCPLKSCEKFAKKIKVTDVIENKVLIFNSIAETCAYFNQVLNIKVCRSIVRNRCKGYNMENRKKVYYKTNYKNRYIFSWVTEAKN